jgi:hypothetical protein
MARDFPRVATPAAGRDRVRLENSVGGDEGSERPTSAALVWRFLANGFILRIARPTQGTTGWTQALVISPGIVGLGCKRSLDTTARTYSSSPVN